MPGIALRQWALKDEEKTVQLLKSPVENKKCTHWQLCIGKQRVLLNAFVWLQNTKLVFFISLDPHTNAVR